MSPERAGTALIQFLKDMQPGDALIVWRDNNEADWHVLQNGESYNLATVAGDP